MLPACVLALALCWSCVVGTPAAGKMVKEISDYVYFSTATTIIIAGIVNIALIICFALII